jgi:hypothetical protein
MGIRPFIIHINLGGVLKITPGIPLFLFPMGLGNLSPWITCQDCLQPSMGMNVCFWLWIASLNWPFCPPARKVSLLKPLLNWPFGLPQTIISYCDRRFLSTFWSSLWSLMDTNLTKSTTFHPQTDGQTEVVNRMIVHILWMYNSKHPHTWDENLSYVQHSYNRALHSSTIHSPFQACMGFQPLAPIDVALPIASTQATSCQAHTEVEKATKFVERIQHIRQQVHDILEKANDKYKQRHDQHRVPHTYQVGDKVWLHLQKERLTRPHRKLRPLHYGPYTITKAIEDNAFELSIPPFLGLHPVFNVELLRPYFPPLLDTSEVAEKLAPTELNPDCLEKATVDRIMDS